MWFSKKDENENENENEIKIIFLCNFRGQIVQCTFIGGLFAN
jgi:hypothetical protein